MAMPWQLAQAKRPKRLTPRPIVEQLPRLDIGDFRPPQSISKRVAYRLHLRTQGIQGSTASFPSRSRGCDWRLGANVRQRATSLRTGQTYVKDRWRCTRSFTSWRCARSSVLGAQPAAAASHNPRYPTPSAHLSRTWAEHFFSANLRLP